MISLQHLALKVYHLWRSSFSNSGLLQSGMKCEAPSIGLIATTVLRHRGASRESGRELNCVAISDQHATQQRMEMGAKDHHYGLRYKVYLNKKRELRRYNLFGRVD